MTDYVTMYTASLVAAGLALGLSVVMGFMTARERSRLPLATMFDSLEEMIAGREKQLAEVEAKLESSRESWARAHQVIVEAKAQQEWLTTNQALLASIKQEREEQVILVTKLQQLAEANAAAEKRAFELTAAVKQYELERDAASDRLKGLSEEFTRREAEHATLAKSLKAMSTELELVTHQFELAKGNQATATRELEKLTKQQTDLASDVKVAGEKLLSVQEQHKKLSVECEGLRTEYKGLETRLASIREEIKLAMQQQTAVNPASADLETRIADLWNPVVNPAAFAGPLENPKEQESLDEVSRELKRQGLRFHERVIAALHTSLKTSKDSPLLVLAGISGTGKSLLPRRYAEAMGMHELTVPVQPGWSSPQDLLGFYNHLQGKFVPTELVRALVQLDQFGNLPERGWPERPEAFKACDERMLLVLLDEMNLARVEYYFSDFLSLLENRRDLDDLSDGVRRAKAEFTLESGPTTDGQGAFRFFVDTNVLFVGTMNEDESTQTLSDKVVDRANVIRFAAPREFPATGVPSKSGPAPKAPQRKFLSFKQWKSWQRVAGGDSGAVRDSVDVDRQINELSQAMLQVGRPFGHRVQRAIKGYVEQYPDRSGQGVRFAMADQIEQRILPKLRGVELSTTPAKKAIDQVLAVLKQLGDEPLQRAVEDGRKGGQQFNWLGVDRANT
jgi:hypothetical protein